MSPLDAFFVAPSGSAALAGDARRRGVGMPAPGDCRGRWPPSRLGIPVLARDGAIPCANCPAETSFAIADVGASPRAESSRPNGWFRTMEEPDEEDKAGS